MSLGASRAAFPNKGSTGACKVDSRRGKRRNAESGRDLLRTRPSFGPDQASSGIAGSVEARARRPRSELDPVPHMQLVAELLDVVLHGVRAQVQPGADLVVRQPEG